MKYAALPFLLLAMSLAADAAQPIRSFSAPYESFGQIERLDPALDALLAADARMEKLAEGFNWSEGPVWMPAERQLIFSDVPENIAYRWREGQGIDIFLQPSGYTGAPAGYDGREPGSNGLALDLQGRLLLCQHGDRRIARLNADGKTFSTVVDRFEGKRFNSPNDLVVDRRGNIYFTDPPYGMGPGTSVELGYHGVFRLGTDGKVTLITKELERPNGLALSPDERTLYVGNSHGPRPIIMAFPLDENGVPGAGRVFFDAAPLRSPDRRGALDGMAVDTNGNLWATGPGGVLIIDRQGKHLGSLLTGQATGNCTFADDGTLYITADMFLVRIATKARGTTFAR
jgi:gluconolactonase